MGDLWVGVKAALLELGVDVVVPPFTSQRTLSLGVKYSPGTVCLPFKLTLGNMIEALELGADTILMVGQYGPCRFGYYHRIQELILCDLGYNFEMVKESLGIIRMVKYIAHGASLGKIVKAIRFGIAKLRILNELERIVYRIRAVEQTKGEASLIYKNAIEAIDGAGDYQRLKQTRLHYLDKLTGLPLIFSSYSPRIGVIGEFFIVIDPFANMDVEIELGKLGAIVCRTQSVYEWIRFNPLLMVLGLREKDKSCKAAKPYLPRHIGGDGRQSVGEKVLHARDWDGLVHLEPFGCLPETMARNIMPSTKEKIPVLNLIYDEHTGKAGMVSRLEAFIDMIYRGLRRKVLT
ncbi:acyl-CoA dehydratase activase-related protein [Chloroflexota bacterium]